MASILDLIRQASGQPDINTQIAAALGQGAGQPGAPQGPQPLAGAQPGAPTASDIMLQHLGSGGPAAGPPGSDGAAPQAPPQPQAYTSTPDMAQLYFKFAQQQHADDQFNRGIAGIAAGFAPSWDRNAILGMGRDTSMDAGSTFGTLMRLQQYEVQRQQLQNYQQSIPSFVKAAGLDPSYIPLMQSNPELGQQIIQAHQPEGMYRNYQLAELDYVKANADMNDPASVKKARSDFETQHPLDQALTPTGGDPAIAALQADKALWMKNNPGETPPDRFMSPEANVAYKTKQATLSGGQTAAAASFPALNGNLLDMRTKAQAILDSPDLAAVLPKAPAITTFARQHGWLASNLPAEYGGVTQNQLDLLHQIDDLSNYNTSGMKSANPHLTANILPIESSLPNLQKFEVGPENYKKNAKSLIDSIDTARAQGVGASGMLSLAAGDPNIEGKIDDSYLPGGQNYVGEAPKPPPSEIAAAKSAIARGAPRDAVIRRLKLKGYLPRPGDL